METGRPNRRPAPSPLDRRDPPVMSAAGAGIPIPRRDPDANGRPSWDGFAVQRDDLEDDAPTVDRMPTARHFAVPPPPEG